jgi:hypothetical protein
MTHLLRLLMSGIKPVAFASAPVIERNGNGRLTSSFT